MSGPDEIILASLRNNLDMLTTSRDAYLMELAGFAKRLIAGEGITLDESDIEDLELVSMYAAYLFRKRAQDNAPMPRMLRYALNNRLFREKVNRDA